MHHDPTRTPAARARTITRRQVRLVKYAPTTFNGTALRREMRTR